MNDSQSSPVQGETPVQGEITDRLLTGQVLPPSRTGSKFASVIWVFVVLILAVLAALLIVYLVSNVDEEAGTDWPDMTYREFRENVGDSELDPRGASHIYYLKRTNEKGESDVWMRMSIQKTSYDALLQRRERDLNKPRFASRQANPTSPLQKMPPTRKVTLPENWPQSGEDSPLWWEPSTAGANAKCSKWEIQETPERAKGWYWAYDPDTTTLWIWEWGGLHRLGSAASKSDDTGDGA